MRQLGHEVRAWDPGFLTPRSILERITQKLRGAPAPSKVRALNQRFIQLCREGRFDLVFVMGETYLSQEALETARKSTSNPRLVFHSHDNLFFHELFKAPDFFETLATYSAVFTTKSQNVVRYQQLGQANSYYIPSAFEPSLHRPIPQNESQIGREYDVTFIGTYDDSRVRWLNQAGWERLHVWGNDWKRFPQFNQYQDRIEPRAVYYTRLADLFSRSRCSLGLLREEAGDLHTQRTFEIPACGSLQFAPRNAEIQTFFEEGKEIVLFDSPEELKDKLDYYLSNESERRSIARAGHQRCLMGGHTYLDRVQTILQSID